MAALVSQDSESIYTDLTSPYQHVYSTLGQTSLNSPGAQHTGHSGQSSHPYRWAKVCLGLLCALLLSATVVLCVFFLCIYLSEQYSMVKRDLEKVQLQSSVSNPCPHGWAQFSSKCYYFSNEMKNWTDSRSDCEEWGADLVIIESEEEQRFINKKIRNFTWIGLRYSAAKGNWLWVNGTPLQKGFWGRGEPNIGFECAMFAHSMKAWSSFYCSNGHNSICETNALLP